ncbi:MAG: alpha/beta fold hydrolase [Pseudomonadota bacterium]
MVGPRFGSGAAAAPRNHGAPTPWRAVLLICMAALLGACAERGSVDFAPAAENATIHRIWAAKFRSAEQADARGAPPRPMEVEYEALDVSVPPTHSVGKIEWPRGIPNAATDFVALRKTEVPALGAFARSVSRGDVSGRGETMIFVHGYNMRHGEAVYQVTQFVHDFEIPVPPVLFSWPSAGVTAGYVYDRDSALMSRNALERLILELSSEGRKVFLVGHSMGSYLIMETLRQISQRRSANVAQRVRGVILIAPDIDGELFRAQAQDIGRLPDPFIVMVARQDRALQASSLLTGRRPRLGNQADRSLVADLPVSLIDVSQLADPRGNNHSIAISSPQAIAALRRLAGQRAPGEVAVSDLLVLEREDEGVPGQ